MFIRKLDSWVQFANEFALASSDICFMLLTARRSGHDYTMHGLPDNGICGLYSVPAQALEGYIDFADGQNGYNMYFLYAYRLWHTIIVTHWKVSRISLLFSPV